MNKRDNETIAVAQIPENFATGSTFLGFEVKPLNLIQAIVFGVIPILISMGINKYFYVNILTVIGVTALCSIAFAFLGFVGIDNVTPLEYLIKYINYKRNMRKTYYNPRVKKEMVSLMAEQSEANQVLPREKILKMYNEFLEKRNLADQAKAHEIEDNDLGEDVFFEDDFLVMDKPKEYMSDKEIKEKEKQEKRLTKQRLKEMKKREKQEKKNAKRKN